VSYLDETEQADHECPTALERPVKEFDVGGQVFTPAGRWETITDLDGGATSLLVQVFTDRAAWQWWGSDRLPYMPDYRVTSPAAVRVFETAHSFEVSVGAARTNYGRGHVLLGAYHVRGTGWQIQDRPAGVGELEHLVLPSKARARTEVNRRARAHAKRLGIPLDGAR
jgi:hypothetical protein